MLKVVAPLGFVLVAASALAGAGSGWQSSALTSVPAHIVGTPYPGATSYANPNEAPTNVPTGLVTSKQVARYGCTLPQTGSLSPCAGETWVHLGTVDGSTLIVKVAIYDHEPAGSTILRARPDEEIGSVDFPGDASDWFASPAPAVRGAFANQPGFPAHYNLNGRVIDIKRGSSRQATFSRAAGTTKGIASNSHGHEFEWTLTSLTLAQALRAVAPPFAPIRHFIGSFFRDSATPPFGALEADVTDVAPSPYPDPDPAHLFGRHGYCTAISTNGFSILTGTPVDYQKINNIVRAGVQWTRSDVYPSAYDVSHDDSGGMGQRAAFAGVDSVQCAEILNNIEPVPMIDAGPVNYGHRGRLISNAIFKSAADYGTWCGVVAAHEKAAFTVVRRFSIPMNENNGGWTSSQAALTDDPAANLGMPGLIAYTRQCYQHIKAVDPTYFVYWGEINFDPGAKPLQFLQEMYRGGCKIGTCFDGISIHVNVNNVATARYDPDESGYQADGAIMPIFAMVARTMQQSGETELIHINISEAGYPSNIYAGFPIGSEADQAFLWGNYLSALEQLPCGPTFCVDGVLPQNFDEDAMYRNTVFGNWGLIDTAGKSQRERPAFHIIQAANRINPAAPPTLVPGTTQATPPA